MLFKKKSCDRLTSLLPYSCNFGNQFVRPIYIQPFCCCCYVERIIFLHLNIRFYHHSSFSPILQSWIYIFLSLSLSLQWRYSPGWASASFRSFLHPSQFRAATFQFIHPSLATSSSTPSSQRSLGLPLGRFTILSAPARYKDRTFRVPQ